MTRSEEEIIEIERHKYFLSERRGFDVGWDFAAEDWDAKHQADWRRSRALQHETDDRRQAVQVAERRVDDASTGVAPAYERGGLRGLVWRLLHRE